MLNSLPGKGQEGRHMMERESERGTGESGVLRTLWDLYFEGVRKARIVENDRVAQKHYRKLYGTGDLAGPGFGEQAPPADRIVD